MGDVTLSKKFKMPSDWEFDDVPEWMENWFRKQLEVIFEELPSENNVCLHEIKNGLGVDIELHPYIGKFPILKFSIDDALALHLDENALEEKEALGIANKLRRYAECIEQAVERSKTTPDWPWPSERNRPIIFSSVDDLPWYKDTFGRFNL